MVSAFIIVKLTLTGGTDVHSIHDALHAVSGVKTVHFVAGPADAILYVEVPDQAALLRTAGEIRAVNGVKNTDTRIVLPL